MILVQGREGMAVLPPVTAVLLHSSATDTWTEAMLIQGSGEMVFVPVVTAVLLYHRSMNAWTEGNVVSTG